MAPECVVVCVDNSAWSINGDFGRTRLYSQADAAKCYFNYLKRSNAENMFGLVDLVNQHLISSFNNDADLAFEKINRLECDGTINVTRAIRVCHLVLKNRPDVKFKSRILIFVHSPFLMHESDVEFLFDQLKTRKISLSVLAFSEHCKEDVEQLKNLVEMLNDFYSKSQDSETHESHFIYLDSSMNLKNYIMNSKICSGTGFSGMPDGTSNTNDSFGFDDNNMDDFDEELQMALKLSKAEFEKQQNTNAANTQNNEGANDASNQASYLPDGVTKDDIITYDEDDQIAYALYLSMQEGSEQKDKKDESPKNENEDDHNNDPKL